MLGDKHRARYYEDGAVAIARLAPQDYHRFHTPLPGKLTDLKHIEGHYYSVHPLAVKDKPPL